MQAPQAKTSMPLQLPIYDSDDSGSDEQIVLPKNRFSPVGDCIQTSLVQRIARDVFPTGPLRRSFDEFDSDSDEIIVCPPRPLESSDDESVDRPTLSASLDTARSCQ